jgi:hypothetical protein
MLMDAMSDINHPPATEKVLDLATRTSAVQARQVVRRFGATWEAIHHTRPRRPSEPSSRQPLAISDLNDILSWEVTKEEFDAPRFTLANIYLGSAGQFLGLPHLPIRGLAARLTRLTRTICGAMM